MCNPEELLPPHFKPGETPGEWSAITEGAALRSPGAVGSAREMRGSGPFFQRSKKCQALG